MSRNSANGRSGGRKPGNFSQRKGKGPPGKQGGGGHHQGHGQGQGGHGGGGGGHGGGGQGQGGQGQGGGRRRRRKNRRGGGGGPGQGPGPQHQHGQRRPPAIYDVDPHANDTAVDQADAVQEPTAGVLEMHPKGYGFLRNSERFYMPQPGDAYVGTHLIQKHNLREGWLIGGPAANGKKGVGPRLLKVETIENEPPEAIKRRDFDALTPIDPHEQIHLETTSDRLTTRVMDLLTPIGKGQRGLIVAPPRTGKTILLQHIAQAVAVNHPEMHIFMLLIDERPEEVTDMRRNIKGEVVASSSDQDSVSHVRLAELVVERAKRIAERGGQAFVLLDSLTRLARAYNKNVGNSGRTMSGGVDIRALEVPKRLFGTARVFEEGGSLTVMGTALIDTGSRMDEVIFQEFKGTGNMELVLDRKLADRRVYPAIDISQSGTRKEERILDPDVLKGVTLLRRSLVSLNPVASMESLVKKLGEYKSNEAFLAKIAAYVR